MTTFQELNNNLDTLELSKVKELLPNYLDSKRSKEKSLTESLLELTKAEIDFRDKRRARKVI